MSQVLNDFLGVLRLASSRLTPARRARVVLRGEVAKSLVSPLSHCRLYCLPFCGCQRGTPLHPRNSPWQERNRLTLESSLGSFPMALQRPDKSKLRSTASPGHLAAFASKSLRNQFSAAVDSGVKGTYTSFLETSLEGMFCTINFLGSGLIYQLLVRFRGRR